jgi:hypothetical protein
MLFCRIAHRIGISSLRLSGLPSPYGTWRRDLGVRAPKGRPHSTPRVGSSRTALASTQPAQPSYPSSCSSRLPGVSRSEQSAASQGPNSGGHLATSWLLRRGYTSPAPERRNGAYSQSSSPRMGYRAAPIRPKRPSPSRGCAQEECETGGSTDPRRERYRLRPAYRKGASRCALPLRTPLPHAGFAVGEIIPGGIEHKANIRDHPSSAGQPERSRKP